MQEIRIIITRPLERDKPSRLRRLRTFAIGRAVYTARRVNRWVRKNRWGILKYAVLTFAGVWLFKIGSAYALKERGYYAIGGEMFALLLPVFYYVFSASVRDFIGAARRNKKGER